jgi:diguanylate cyclase (GGDEF)-like protein
MLRLCGVLDSTPVPELDFWTAALQRTTGAKFAGTCFFDGAHGMVKSSSTAAGPADPAAEIALPEFPEGCVVGLERLVGSTNGGGVYSDVPVTLDGHVIGRVYIVGDATRRWVERDLQALEHASAAVTAEVALRLARTEASRSHQLVASNSKVHDLIARAAPLRDVLLEVLESIQRYDSSIKPSVLLLDPASSTLHSGIGPSLPPEYLAGIDGVVIGPNVGTCGAAAWSGHLTITENIAEDPKWAPIQDKARACGLAHCWSMPITASGGNVLGTLAFYGSQPRRPLPEHVTLLEDWARVAGIAIERHQSLVRLTHDARHDSLTGLANRIAIFERLDEAIQRVTPTAMAAVLFIDLDGVKLLNDTVGHDHADEMLREMAGRLSATVRSNDFVGRLGGDEFVVIAEGLADLEEAAALGLRFLDAISRPLPGPESTVVTASIGIAPVRSNLVEARQAIRDSDSAMYAAKRAGRDRCAFYEGGQHVRTGRRLEMARALRGAEVRGELRLVFQPVLALPDLNVVGVEALLRWTSPTFFEVSPVEFIPISDDTGTIVPIGAWALRESCETMAQLSAAHPLMLNVNVSARQISNPGFTLWVRQTLAHSEFPADRLGLEITETALLRPNSATMRTLHELDSLGVGIVLDDFGTGYSSLSWLKQRPFSEIKIDRSFISGLPDNEGDLAIVGGVIAMARAFGSLVTAEGVETKEQLALLQTLACDRVQGFLLARPLPAGDLVRFLSIARVGPPSPVTGQH